MKIAVCDDEKVFRDSLVQLLNQYSVTHRQSFEIDEYDDGIAFLNNTMAYDIIFLDHQMPTLNGLDTIQALREKNDKSIVIFCSSYPEIVFDSMKFKTFRFLIKPVEAEKFTEALDAAIHEINSDCKIVLKDTESGENIVIPEKDIIYAQADNICTYIITPNASLRYSYNLTSLENELHSDFFMRTHRTYLVNLHFIASYDHKVITLTNGHKALISRLKYKDFCNCYMTFIKNLRGFK